MPENRSSADPYAVLVAESKKTVLSAIGRHLNLEYHHSLDDVVQETYLRYFRKYPSLRPEDINHAYLHTIARNEAIRMNTRLYREEKKRMKLRNDIGRESEDDSSRFLEKKELLRESLARVPDRFRDVVRLRLDGYGNDEISEKLGIAGGTVKSRLHRGLAILRREKATGEGES